MGKHSRDQVRAQRARAVSRAKRRMTQWRVKPEEAPGLLHRLTGQRTVCSCIMCGGDDHAKPPPRDSRQDAALDRQLEDAIFATEKAVR